MSQSPTSPVEGFSSPPSSPELNIDEGPTQIEEPESALLPSEKADSENLPQESVESGTDQVASDSVNQVADVVSCCESGDTDLDTFKLSNSTGHESDECKRASPANSSSEEHLTEVFNDVEATENSRAASAPDTATDTSDSRTDGSLNIATKCSGPETEITKLSCVISQSVDENATMLCENSNSSMHEYSPTNEDNANDLKSNDFNIDDAMDTSQTSPVND